MKVFSLKKFIDHCRKLGDSELEIEQHVSDWARYCDGKTQEECPHRTLHEDWLIELPDQVELKACPFCGSNHVAPDSLGWYMGAWIIKCEECAAQTDIYVTEALAIKAWNRRAK